MPLQPARDVPPPPRSTYVLLITLPIVVLMVLRFSGEYSAADAAIFAGLAKLTAFIVTLWYGHRVTGTVYALGLAFLTLLPFGYWISFFVLLALKPRPAKAQAEQVSAALADPPPAEPAHVPAEPMETSSAPSADTAPAPAPVDPSSTALARADTAAAQAPVDPASTAPARAHDVPQAGNPRWFAMSTPRTPRTIFTITRGLGVAGVAVAVFSAVFSVFVWPTRYRYDELAGAGGVKVPVRTDRFTSEVQILTPSGWVREDAAPPAVAKSSSADDMPQPFDLKEVWQLRDGRLSLGDAYRPPTVELYNPFKNCHIKSLTISVTIAGEARRYESECTAWCVSPLSTAEIRFPRIFDSHRVRPGNWSWDIVAARVINQTRQAGCAFQPVERVLTPEERRAAERAEKASRKSRVN